MNLCFYIDIYINLYYLTVFIYFTNDIYCCRSLLLGNATNNVLEIPMLDLLSILKGCQFGRDFLPTITVLK